MRSTLAVSKSSTGRKRLLTGWGRTAPSQASVYEPVQIEQIATQLTETNPRGVIARGLGRSYGDAAQNAGGTVLSMLNLKQILAIDQSTGDVTVQSGVSINALIKALLPIKRFPVVTPGTRYVTIGGAIAADIHGKNHHLDGSFCDHVTQFKLLTPTGEIRAVSTQSEPDLFAATAGGMGLTGIVLEASLRTRTVETNRVWVETERANNLDDALTIMNASDNSYRYSAAWIDCSAGGKKLGRSVLTRGDHALLEDLPASQHEAALTPQPEPRINVPITAPAKLINRPTIRLFNEFWFKRAPKQRRGLESVFSFLYPLDGIARWNRLYGKPGFLQYQFVVPFGQEKTLTTMIEQLSQTRVVSLGVLKRFGEQQQGLISFPVPGWTLAVDIPARFSGITKLLDKFDELVATAGGRVYLAKDSRLRPELLRQFYPQLERWQAIQGELDPAGQMQSDLARRTRLRPYPNR